MKKFNYLYLILIILFLGLPVLQKETHVFPENKLNGVTHRSKKKDFNFDNWMDGSFQRSFDKWLSKNFGFKTFFVKLYNQYQFTAFDKLGAFGIQKTENNLLFQTGYLEEFVGKDVLPEADYDSLCRKMSEVSAWLKENEKQFLYVIAPGKVSVYPELINDSLQAYKQAETNYRLLAGNLQQYNIPSIDFQQYFIDYAGESPYTVFPRCGTHWSGYASTLAADSIITYLRNEIAFPLNNYSIQEGYTTESEPVFTDNDLGKLINLLFPLPLGELHYPELLFNTADIAKPRLLIIGDSFAQSFWHFNNFFPRVFADSSMYWYYNNGKEWKGMNVDMRINNLEILQYIDKIDIVIVLSTEINHKTMAFGFIDELHTAVFDTSRAREFLYGKLFEKRKRVFKHNPDIMKKAYQKKRTEKIPLDSALNIIVCEDINEGFADGQLYY